MNPSCDHIVSIIMPVHNAEATLSDAVESVLAQTYDRWELLIVDDHSDDGSMAIAHRYAAADPRIRVGCCEEHTGLPATPRNHALQMATGRYIAFLDSDDLWLPDKLAHQLPLFDQPQVAVVFSDYEKTTDGKPTGRRVAGPASVGYKQLLKSNFIGNLTGIYDTRKVGKVAIRNIHHEDYAMWLTILKQGYVAQNTQTVEALYRLSTSSVTGNKLKLLGWQWNIYRREERMGIVSSAYYYMHYALRALLKRNI